MQSENLRPATIVTGGSTGVGRELALLAARDGHHVVLAARSVDRLAAVEAEIRAAGGSASSVPVDLMGPGAADALLGAVAAQGFYCAVLVNNAGYGMIGPAERRDRAEQVGMVDLNCRTLTDLALAVLPGMVARGAGGIINVASVAGFLPGPGMAVYYASKAYVVSFSEALFHEMRGKGVIVTALCPGPFLSGFAARAGMEGASPGGFKLLPKRGAAEVALAGWQGFKAGRRRVVPGLRETLVTAIAPALPRALLLPIVAGMQKGRTPESI